VNKVTDNKPKILEKRVGRLVKPDAPLVSVVIPAYNVAEYIAETLDSALAQTFSDFETIVVNDGSPDTARLEKVLFDYFDKIIYLKQENGGAAAARNTAISERARLTVGFSRW
jgi:glycosyltransferase involved in cell wall biosynthesis